MVINVRVSPQASRNLVKEDGSGFKVYLSKPAREGLANNQLVELLAKYFKVKKYQVAIIRGENSKNKLVRIDV